MGYTDVMIVAGSHDQLEMYQDMLGSGDRYGMAFDYTLQDEPDGIASVFHLCHNWIGHDPITLILGDNIFIGTPPIDDLNNSIYTYKVKDPSAYGVAVINDRGDLESITEKPKEFISEDAVVGLYVFNDVGSAHPCAVVHEVGKSARGEYEITDLIEKVNERGGRVKVKELQNTMWYDVGSFDSLLDCANLVRTIETRSTQILGLQEI